MNFTLPNGAVTDISSSTSALIDDFSSPVILIVGILFALYVIDSIIYILIKKNE